MPFELYNGKLIDHKGGSIRKMNVQFSRAAKNYHSDEKKNYNRMSSIITLLIIFDGPCGSD